MDASEVSALVMAALTAAATWWGSRQKKTADKLKRTRSIKQKKQAAITNAMRGQAQVYSALSLARESLGADRLLLLATHNGGDKVEQVGTRLYVSVFAEVRGEDTPQVLLDWNARRVNRDYLNFLVDLRRRKALKMTPEELEREPNHHLRDMYRRDGLSCSMIVEVGTTTGKYWFLSASYREPREFLEWEGETLAETAGELIDILQLDVLSSFESYDNARMPL